MQIMLLPIYRIAAHMGGTLSIWIALGSCLQAVVSMRKFAVLLLRMDYSKTADP